MRQTTGFIGSVGLWASRQESFSRTTFVRISRFIAGIGPFCNWL
jgi:hypothetical protein